MMSNQVLLLKKNEAKSYTKNTLTFGPWVGSDTEEIRYSGLRWNDDNTGFCLFTLTVMRTFNRAC
jgi:hypothetical protein